MKKAFKLIALLLIISFLLPLVPVQAQSLGSSFLMPLSADDLKVFLPGIKEVPTTSKVGNVNPTVTGGWVLETPVDEKEYRLGPGDVIAVNLIVGESAMTITNQFLVGADGKIFYPNLGELYLSGLNLVEAKAALKKLIDRSFKESYQLSLLLAQPKKVKIYLTGMVKTPGPLVVYDSQRVSEVISQAGGVVSGGSNRYVFITRRDAQGESKILQADIFAAYQNRDLSSDLRVQAGDIIEVPDANLERISQVSVEGVDAKRLLKGKETFVSVYGELAKSGRYEYIPGMRLSDYISFAGGPTSRAALRSVTVTRQVDGRAKTFSVDADDVLYKGKANADMEILAGDVINVPANFFYFSDFASFANTIILAFTLYNLTRK